jgi:uncharacterized phage infection (PIP) family protein YhgE
MKRMIRLGLCGAAIAAATLFALFLSFRPAQAASEGTCGNNLQCVIAFGNARIQERVTALNTLIARVQANQYLTDSQRDAIQTDARTNINGLQTLKTKLDGETNIANARTDVHNIYAQFRIFAVVLPRDYHEVWLDHMTNLHDQFVSGEPTINQAIQAAANKGINVTQEQQQYNDLVAKVGDAGTQLTSAQGLIPSLIPANFPGTNQTLATLRGDLKQAHTDLAAAAKDLNDITQELKAAGA